MAKTAPSTIRSVRSQSLKEKLPAMLIRRQLAGTNTVVTVSPRSLKAEPRS